MISYSEGFNSTFARPSGQDHFCVEYFMNLYEAIFSRKSVRSYTEEPVDETLLDRIRQYYTEQVSPFESMETDFTIIDAKKSPQPLLRLLSVRAPYYMVFYSEEGPRYLMNAGYRMEQMNLFLCSIGLGACFVGSSRIRKDLQQKGNLQMVGILAFGWPKEKLVRKHGEAKRLSLEELCVFKEQPRQWMKQLLEAARLAPSYMNQQPWRFVVFDNRIHIFSKRHQLEQMKKWEEVNFGTMFANMMTAAEELWLDIDLIKLENISQKNFPNNQYILSAVLKSS